MYKERTDGFIAFHFFEKEVEVGGAIVTAGVNVGERDNKVYEFSLSAYGLGHAGMPSWAKAKAHQTYPVTSQGPGGPKQVGITGASDADLDAIVHEKDDSLNIFILKVVDKATGQRMTELEDDFAAPEAKPTAGSETGGEASQQDNPSPDDDAPPVPRKQTSQNYEFDPNRKPAQRKADNAAAMALLEGIDAGTVDAKHLTPEDKLTLAKYSGTGGALIGADGKSCNPIQPSWQTAVVGIWH